MSNKVKITTNLFHLFEQILIAADKYFSGEHILLPSFYFLLYASYANAKARTLTAKILPSCKTFNKFYKTLKIQSFYPENSFWFFGVASSDSADMGRKGVEKGPGKFTTLNLVFLSHFNMNTSGVTPKKICYIVASFVLSLLGTRNIQRDRYL